MNLQEVHSTKKMNNKGSAIILVIIAMCFIGVLAALILWLAYMNYFMKAMQLRSTNNFYTAEQVVEEIRAGLQDEVANSAGSAYSTVLQRYSELDTNARKAYFNTTLVTEINKIIDPSSTGKYDADILKNRYVTSDLFANSVITAGSKVQIDAGNKQGLITFDVNQGYVILHDLNVKYTDSRNDVSEIHTDFKIAAPDLDFSDSPTTDELFSYGIIANRVLQIPNGSTLNVDLCNVYAGGFDITTPDPAGATIEEITGEKRIKESLLAYGNLNAINSTGAAGNKNFISGRQITIGQDGAGAGSSVDMVDDFDLWTDNIALDGVSSSLKLRGKSYVSDDLTLNGNKAKAELSGWYYGYGMDTNYKNSNYNSATEPTDDKSGDNSSAILLNGKLTFIDLSSLSELWLMGRSYVGTRDVAGISTSPANKVNIPMSESISIRGDQVAYLVPDSCLAVWVDDADKKYHKWEAVRNPMSMSEYTTNIENNRADGKFTECDLSMELDDLGTNIASFGANTKFQKVFTQGLDGNGMVYYYIVMDATDANNYFKTYYDIDQNKNALTKYANRYVDQIVTVNEASTTMNIAGNWITAVQGVGSDGGNNNKVDLELHTPNSVDITTLADQLSGFQEAFECLEHKLVSRNVTADKRDYSAYTNLVDDIAVTSFLSGGSEVFEYEDPADPTKKFRAVIVDGDYTYDTEDPQLRLIIATGNINLEKNFEGCAIAKYDINTAGNITVTNDADTQQEIKYVLAATKTHGLTEKAVYEFFKDGSGYVLPGGTTPTAGDGDFTVNDMVTYMNWTKNGIE